MVQYGRLASVYDWLVPDSLLEPGDAVAAFGSVVATLRPGSRVLDCAAGTGQLAVGLALRGFEVVATDASDAMIERARLLGDRHGVGLHAQVCRWEHLDRVVDGSFDAVFCVGNSLVHAEGESGRRAALAGMGGVLRSNGLLVLTARNWERLLAQRPGLEIEDRLTERGGTRGLVARCWTFPVAPEEVHLVDVAVALLRADGSVETTCEQLSFWPFTRQGLDEDLRASGLVPESSTYSSASERYLVTARRRG